MTDYWEKYREKGYDPERLRTEYDAWEKKTTFINIDQQELTHDLIKDLTFLSSLTVEQYTLLRKWREIQEYRVKNNVKTVKYDFFAGSFADKLNVPELDKIKSKIWRPESPEDYLKLEPRLTICNNNKVNLKRWGLLRSFTSTMLNNSIPGRNIRFIAYDAVTEKYLGVICISSDFMDLTARDNKIGWSREVKTAGKMINHVCIGSTIVPTQPLGYNFVGGKLLALLTLSDYSENAWTTHAEVGQKLGDNNGCWNTKRQRLQTGPYELKKEKDVKYDRLVGLTTTSLYGSFSQYNSLKYWKKVGHSAGSIKYEPSREIVNRCKEWLKFNHPVAYWEWYEAKSNTGHPFKRDFKQRSLAWMYKEFDVPKEIIQSDHTRGIYFCTLFNKTNEFLRKEITEDELLASGKRFDNSIEAIAELWKTKYASKRVKRLSELGTYSDESLFYDELIYLDTWEEVNSKYIKNVGR